MIGAGQVTAAVAIVGADILANTTWQISSRRRVLKGIAVVGSTAINDFSATLYIEDRKILDVINTRAGVLAPLQDDFIPIGARAVPPGAKISLIVTNGAVTNPIHYIIF